MKNNKLLYRNVVIKCLIACIFLSFGSGCKRQELVNREPQPTIEFHDDTYDFGYCEKGEKLFHDFPFSNKGDKILNIEVRKSSCRCTVVKLEKSQYMPGETGSVHIELDTEARLGIVVGSILLATNDQLYPEVILTVKATIRGVHVEPKTVDFGKIVKSQNMEKRITIESYGLPEFAVSKLKTSTKNVKITTVDKKSDGNEFPDSDDFRKEYLVMLFTDNVPLGDFSGEIVIQTNNEKYNHFNIPISANIHGQIQSIPPVINYGVVNTGSRCSRAVKIKSKNNQKIQIKEVAGLLPGMEYDLSEISSDVMQMNLSLTASNNPGLYEGKLKISIEQDVVEILLIPYTLVVKK